MANFTSLHFSLEVEENRMTESIYRPVLYSIPIQVEISF